LANTSGPMRKALADALKARGFTVDEPEAEVTGG
jgi:hypothetical protein